MGVDGVYTFFIHKFLLHMLLAFMCCKLNVYVGIGTPSKLQPIVLLRRQLYSLMYHKAECYLGPTSAARFNGLLGLLRLVTACMDDRWEEGEDVMKSRFNIGIVSFDLFHMLGEVKK